MSDFYSSMYNPDVLTCLANLSNDEVFTPPEVANRMLDMLPEELWHDSSATFLDPACKSGVFLREIAKRLIEGLKEEIPDLQKRIDHIFHKQLYGIAITELTSLLSRRSVYCSKYPNSKYSITLFEDTSGNIRYKRIPHRWQNGKCLFCGASKSEYERGDELETHAYEWIHTTKPEEIFKMKFDVIIGNPPYQLNVGVKKENYAIPIYQKFVEQSQKLKPRYLVMITPSRWFTGGRGLEQYRTAMLNDTHLRKIVDFPNSKDCFNGVDISGGVNYFLWDRDNSGKCEFISVHDGKECKAIRDLNEFSIFPRYNEALSIIHKIIAKKEKNLTEQVSTQTPFGFITTFRGRKTPFNDCLTLISSSETTYVSRAEVSRNVDIIDKYKVIISKATCEHAGTPDKNGQFRVISSNRIIKPGEVCTQSYLVSGAFDNPSHAENFLTYLRTKFFRFLLLQALTSQDISKEKFVFVPNQIYNNPWTDEELYKKYGLTDEEISFIESMIKPIEVGSDTSGN